MAANPTMVLALGLFFGTSLGMGTAQAASSHQGASHRKPAKKPVDVPARATEDAADDDLQPDAKTVALDARDDDADRVDDKAPDPDAAKLVAVAPAHTSPGWQLEIGPYLWASSVQATASFGRLSTGIDLGFVTLVRHTRYGAEALAELRHGRFAISGDVMYGVAAFTAGTTIASVMATVAGNASSLMLDTAAGYQVLGDEEAPISLEARSGIRYQHMTLSGELGAAGISVQTPEIVDSATDVVVGARAVVRPVHALRLSGMFDIGVAGASDRTWSAAVDASLRVSSHVLVTAGWRTLTTERSLVNITMRGPRLAVQLVF
jgi:hypothetical protein